MLRTIKDRKTIHNGMFQPPMPLDLAQMQMINEQLIKNKPATFFMRVNSDAMIDTGIHNGDVVIVDRSLEAKNAKVVIAILDGEMLIRRLEINEGKKRLLPATKKLSPIEVNNSNDFSIWGVVTYVIHSL